MAILGKIGLGMMIISGVLLILPAIAELFYTIKFKMEEEDDYANPGMSARDAWRKHHGGID